MIWLFLDYQEDFKMYLWSAVQGMGEGGTSIYENGL